MNGWFDNKGFNNYFILINSIKKCAYAFLFRFVYLTFAHPDDILTYIYIIGNGVLYFAKKSYDSRHR